MAFIKLTTFKALKSYVMTILTIFPSPIVNMNKEEVLEDDE
jgi:hypothetical protein